MEKYEIGNVMYEFVDVENFRVKISTRNNESIEISTLSLMEFSKRINIDGKKGIEFDSTGLRKR